MAEKLGVAFSGGGIRSAAFCSGVLRRLIRTKKEPDYLSCVSGGGYTGSAYVHWKYHRGDSSDDQNQDQSKWTDEFFDQMRNNAGHYWNRQKCCCQGCCDCFILGLLFLFIIAMVLVGFWGAFACPIAFTVKFMYGQFLDGTRCRRNADSTDCLERTLLFSISAGSFVVSHSIEYVVDFCQNEENYLKMKTPKVFLKLGQLISGATFAFTFFPWFINDFLQYMHIVIRILIVVITAVFWFFIPVLRKYSSMGILVYAYSYVVYWHVYKGDLFFIKYTEERFRYGMIFSLVMLAVFSLLGDFPQRFVHLYNRWRLQKAFYFGNEDHCYCYDCFPGSHCWYCCPPKSPDTSDKPALTLGDLKDRKPLYISNIVANNWRKEHKRKYCLLTMSPEGISVIDQQPTSTAVQIEDNDYSGNKQQPTSTAVQIDGNKLTPGDIKLSSAMAMSAAAVSPYLGKYEESERQFTHILTVCGIEMAADIVYDMTGERNEHWCGKLLSYIINLVIAIGGVLGIMKMLTISSLPVVITVAVVGGAMTLNFLIIIIIVFKIWCCTSKERHSDSIERYPHLNASWKFLGKKAILFYRWCVVHLPICRFFRSILSTITDGKTPPAMMHLSDGGHFENLGLLHLLKLRLPKILVVNGSYIESNDDYATEIIRTMELARELFDCSFTSIKSQLGGDVLTDINNKYVHSKDAKPPRQFEFKVRYSGESDNTNEVTEGHIVLIAPRRPPEKNQQDSNNQPSSSEAVSQRGHGSQDDDPKSRSNPVHTSQPEGPSDGQSIEMTEPRREAPSAEPSPSPEPYLWQDKKCEGEAGAELSEKGWGTGPYLTNDDVEEISGCCYSKRCCKFPSHPTAFQFFTPPMFTAYHREGYRACMECNDFLGVKEI